MPISAGDLFEVTLNSQVGSNRLMSVWSYEVGGSFPTVDAVHLAEAWWNYTKANYRAMIYATAGWVYTSVVVKEMNDPAGELAEWNIPTGEQQGTRTAPAAPEFLPIFNATGVRLTVGTRVTRPGQKRVYGLTETDNESGVASPAWMGLVATLVDALDGEFTLLAPALGVDLIPSVFRKDGAGDVIAHQAVTGNVPNRNITSQVSRRLGRGI